MDISSTKAKNNLKLTWEGEILLKIRFTSNTTKMVICSTNESEQTNKSQVNINDILSLKNNIMKEVT